MFGPGSGTKQAQPRTQDGTALALQAAFADINIHKSRSVYYWLGRLVLGNMNTPKKIAEPLDVEQLLRFWLIHGHKGRERHDRAARRCDRIRLWLGGCATVFSAVVGTSVFAALSQKPSEIWVQVSVASVAILSAILTGLGSYLNLSERAEKHRFAGVRYKEAIRELKRILSVSVSSLGNTDRSVTAIQDRFDQLEESAPVVPERIYDQVEEGWKEQSFVFVTKADELYTQPGPSA